MRLSLSWLLLLFLASCGKLIDDTDAGDAAIPKDASEATTTDTGGSGLFSCGETGHFIDCDSTTQYCMLVKTSKTHDYSCQTLPADCTTPASSKYDCGCFQSGDEIFLTICK
jgi:hypothetical protein